MPPAAYTEPPFRERIAALPGIGASLSQRIIDAGICTLEDLEMACYDGRLDQLEGFADGRRDQLRAALDRILGQPVPEMPMYPRPPVDLLLAVDDDYRRLAAADLLPRVAPLRFNPHHRPWLPVMHTDRDGWELTATYSNSARAFLCNKRRDWVVIVYVRVGESDLATVVTEHRPRLYGQRVVRGREAECRAYYDAITPTPGAAEWAHQMGELLSGGVTGHAA